jgi:NAD(P)-dependent dehydrogenase (short-subunit alcohol dehydrogenase family)
MLEISEVAEAAGAPLPVFIPCDLMSFKSVNQAGTQLRNDFAKDGIDILCNNAGIMAFNDTRTEDGCDIQMQTNHTSHFLLTYYCMPLLEKAASLRGEARIVNHASAARCMDVKNFANKLDAKYFDKSAEGSLGGDSSEFFAGANFQRYQQTKLANVVFTYALRDRLRAAGSKVKALVAHPGVAPTELMQGTMKQGGMPQLPLCVQNIMGAAMMQSEADGSIGILYGTCATNAQSGEFYGPLGKGGATGDHDDKEYSGPHGVLKEEPLADKEAQDTLWSASEKVTGITFKIP